MLSLSMSSLCQPSSQSWMNVCSMLVQGCRVLRAVRAVDQRGIFIRPRSRRFRGEPAVLARGCLAVRDSFEGEDAAVEIAAHFAVLRLRDCGTRRRQISGALMSGGLDAVGRGSEVRRRKPDACGGGKNQCFAPSEPGALGRIGHESPFLDRCRNVSREHSRGPNATNDMSNLRACQFAFRIHAARRPGRLASAVMARAAGLVLTLLARRRRQRPDNFVRIE